MSQNATSPDRRAGHDRRAPTRSLACVLTLTLPLISNCRATDAHQAEVIAVLDAQVEAWNRGDFDGFMEHYWKSDHQTFVSTGAETDPETGVSSRVTRTIKGWRPTLERYKRRYPTRERMGTLTFRELEIARMGDAEAAVSGRFHLARASADHLGGTFNLDMRRMDGAWVIVSDSTVSD